MTHRIEIEEALQTRIEESRRWVDQYAGSEFQTHEIRGHPARIRILKFLDDDRVEANGVRFRLLFGSETKQFFTDLEVRINPNWYRAEGKDDVPPYVVVYALDEKKKGDELHCFNISSRGQLNESSGIEGWYEKYIRRCTQQGDDKKIMIHRRSN